MNPSFDSPSTSADEPVSVLLSRYVRRLAKFLGAPNSEEEDRAIEEAMAACLQRQASVDVSNVHVSVTDGQITLRGQLESEEAIDRVEEIALELVGDGNVESTLCVAAVSAEPEPSATASATAA